MSEDLSIKMVILHMANIALYNLIKYVISKTATALKTCKKYV